MQAGGVFLVCRVIGDQSGAGISRTSDRLGAVTVPPIDERIDPLEPTIVGVRSATFVDERSNGKTSEREEGVLIVRFQRAPSPVRYVPLDLSLP